MAKLGVNVDHVATLRQARLGKEPDPVAAAALAELAGADGITVHLREDRRHIQERDVRALRDTVMTHLNLEMAATDEMVRFALKIKPNMVTLVPEKRHELTTEGGLDVVQHSAQLQGTVALLRKEEILVSLFVDPELDQIKASAETGADYIEIHTGSYCAAKRNDRGVELRKVENSILAATNMGLGVNAGHGLNYQNIRPILALGGIEEFNIGHSIISRAVFIGMDRAVREMAEVVHGSR